MKRSNRYTADAVEKQRQAQLFTKVQSGSEYPNSIMSNARIVRHELSDSTPNQQQSGHGIGQWNGRRANGYLWIVLL